MSIGCPDRGPIFERPFTVDGKFGILVGSGPRDQPDVSFEPIRLSPGDMVVVSSVGGEIWSGVWFTGRNGPRGWENWPAPNDRRWTLPGANIYSLIGVFRDFATGVTLGAFFVGNGTGCVPVPNNVPSFLRLEVNDQWSLDNDGAFSATVTIWRRPRW